MLQPGRISYSRRNPGAVEIGTETGTIGLCVVEPVPSPVVGGGGGGGPYTGGPLLLGGGGG